jgi:hypothetical protein
LLIVCGGLLFYLSRQPGAGLLAATLLAFNPLLIRMTSEGRGYGLMAGLIPLTWLLALLAWRRGGWGWWLAYGLSQALALGANLSCYYIIFLQNVTFLGLLAWTGLRAWRGPPAWWRPAVSRFVVANLLTLFLLAPWVFPSIPQMFEHLALDRAKSDGSIHWIHTVMTFTILGIPEGGHAAFPSLAGLNTLGAGGEWRRWFGWLAFPALALLGAVAAFCRGKSPLIIIVPAAVLALPLAIADNLQSQRLVYNWYFAFTVPGLMILSSLALARAPRWFSRNASRGARLAAVVMIAFAALYITALRPAWPLLSLYPKQPLRLAAAGMHVPVDPTGRESNHVIAIAAWAPVPHYYPRMAVIHGEHTIREAMAKADATGRPLFVAIASRSLIHRYMPGGLELVDDRQVFALTAAFHGLEEPNNTLYILRYRGTPFRPLAGPGHDLKGVPMRPPLQSE